ncbi:MAG: hypothetical protein K0S27_684 [Gammaproteobacteria bacterium]|nr:hypothetical protein [Gammaproteobacteria bacterium]
MLFIFFSLLLATSASLSHALVPTLPQIIGQAVWVKGTLKATLANAEPRLLARRSAIYEHDTLTTDSTSTGEIVFTDNSVMTLRENSTIQINKYRYDKGSAPSNDTFIADVAKGGFRTLTGAISKNNPGGYKATTPVATIGVSGTIYSVYFNRIKQSLAAKLDKGSIMITNKSGKITLTKCSTGNMSEPCTNQVYAEVNGTNTPPTAVSEQPAIFNAEPPLTPTTYPSPSGDQTIGGFCIN